jgi:hypothetical protein
MWLINRKTDGDRTALKRVDRDSRRTGTAASTALPATMLNSLSEIAIRVFTERNASIFLCAQSGLLVQTSHPKSGIHLSYPSIVNVPSVS